MTVTDDRPAGAQRDADQHQAGSWAKFARVVGDLLRLPEEEGSSQLGYAISNSDWPPTRSSLSASQAEEALERLDRLDPEVLSSTQNESQPAGQGDNASSDAEEIHHGPHP